MLPTFVIGLREGLEAALIVGIIAAFLRKQGRQDLLRWVLAGVALAVGLCLAVGVALDAVSRDLPQRQQEGLETVIGILAVAMVTYMVVWMRRHSRELKGSLETAAAFALDSGGSKAGRAMVVMAFLAVLREGFETVVFLLAAFNENGGSRTTAGLGAALGIAVAVALGWGIYRGGVSLNLSKFFRATGLVLVLVAGGLVVTALHTAHEAGWLDAGQGATVNLTWLVRPGSVQASLLTGMLGVQPHPVVIEVIGWFAYLIPVGLFVGWPPGRGPSRARATLAATVIGAAAVVAALVVAVTAPGSPSLGPTTAGAGLAMRATTSPGDTLLLHAATSASSAADTFSLHPAGATVRGGTSLTTYSGTLRRPVADPGRTMLSAAAIARRNGGRLPLGLTAGATSSYRITRTAVTTVTAAIEPRTRRVVSGTVTTVVLATVHSSLGAIPLAVPTHRSTVTLPSTSSTVALAAARHDLSALDRRSDQHSIAIALGVLALLAILGAGASVTTARRRDVMVDKPTQPLVGHKVRLT